MSGCGARLGLDPVSELDTLTEQYSVPATPVPAANSSGWQSYLDLGVKSTTAILQAKNGNKAATSGAPVAQPAPAGSLTNWLNSQSNTTLAIGSISALGLLLAVTR
jgi:hypothetical protein